MTLLLKERSYKTDELLQCIISKNIKNILQIIVGNSEEFFESIFEKHPTIYRASRADKQYKEIFSRIKLLEVITDTELDVELNIRSYKYDKYVRKDRPFKKEMITKSEIESCFKTGNSVQFFQPQRFSDYLHVINAGFEHSFGSLAGASAYLTPAETQGLAPHHDDVCVFVIQVEGSKRWHLWQGDIELPEHHSSDISREQLPKACTELVLHQGDILYLPRGVIHEAISLNDFSTHVTISVYQRYNTKALLSILLDRVLEKAADSDVQLRRGLPIRISDKFGSFVGSDKLDDSVQSFRGDYLLKLSKIIADLATQITPAEVDASVDQLAHDFVRNRLPPLIEPTNSHTNNNNNNKKRKAHSDDLTMESYVQLYDPHCSFYEVEEVEGVKMLCLAHNKNNVRLAHTGHPITQDGDKNSESSQDEERDDERVDEGCADVEFNLMLPPFIGIPLLLKLRIIYDSGFVQIRQIIQDLRENNLDADLVMHALEKLHAEGFLLIK